MQKDVKLVRSQSPFITKKWDTKRVMIDVLIALLPAVIFAVVYFGGASLLRMVVAVAVAILTEALIFPLSQKEDRKAEGKWKKFLSRYQNFSSLNILTSAITGLIFALTLPPKINVYVVVMGSIFAIAIGKMVFGGTGNNIFNPAVVGRVFVALAFGSFFNTAANPELYAVAGATPLTNLKQADFAGALANYSLLDLFLGTIPGSMGEVSAIAILVGAAYLIVRRAADWKIMLSVVVPTMVFALMAGLGLGNVNIIQYVLFHTLTGGLLFGAVFMATDPVTSPLHVTTKMLFGLVIAIITMLNRLFGPMPEGVAFSILFANMITPMLDKIQVFKNRFNWQFGVTYGVAFIAMILIVFFGVGGAL
ncbi:MAG: RnfABCDGE type electron transport complex subunit D [Acholeplasmataceae bacterium]|jgi:electron transport complex protein RnfD